MTIDSRLAQAIADAGAPTVTVFAVRLARIGYEMAVEDAQREIRAKAVKYVVGEVAEHCAEIVGKLKEEG